MSEPKLNLEEESSAKKTRSPPKKAKVEQSVPRKKKLKTDVEKTAEKAQHLRFGKAELTPDELSRNFPYWSMLPKWKPDIPFPLTFSAFPEPFHHSEPHLMLSLYLHPYKCQK